MVPLKDLKEGMKVKIVDKWVPGCCQNTYGRMDHWLGKVVTIWHVNDSYAEIKEDSVDRPGGWAWAPESFDCIVADDEQLSDTEFSPASDDVFQSLFSQSSGKEAPHG